LIRTLLVLAMAENPMRSRKTEKLRGDNSCGAPSVKPRADRPSLVWVADRERVEMHYLK